MRNSLCIVFIGFFITINSFSAASIAAPRKAGARSAPRRAAMPMKMSRPAPQRRIAPKKPKALPIRARPKAAAAKPIGAYSRPTISSLNKQKPSVKARPNNKPAQNISQNFSGIHAEKNQVKNVGIFNANNKNVKNSYFDPPSNCIKCSAKIGSAKPIQTSPQASPKGNISQSINKISAKDNSKVAVGIFDSNNTKIKNTYYGKPPVCKNCLNDTSNHMSKQSMSQAAPSKKVSTSIDQIHASGNARLHAGHTNSNTTIVKNKVMDQPSHCLNCSTKLSSNPGRPSTPLATGSKVNSVAPPASSGHITQSFGKVEASGNSKVSIGTYNSNNTKITNEYFKGPALCKDCLQSGRNGKLNLDKK